VFADPAGIYERIGGYDPEYFLTIEDVCDLCIRAKRSGCRVVFLPEAEIFHFTGRSGVQAPYIVVWHGNRGTVYHFLKHKGILQALLVSLLLIGAAAARIAVASILSIAKRQYRDVARISQGPLEPHCRESDSVKKSGSQPQGFPSRGNRQI
jgi:GT2 family glycosyltransferase